MKYICHGYLDTEAWVKLSESQQNAMIDDCLTYDDELRKNGHFAGGEGLGGPDQTKSLRFKNGKVVATDGPFTETKELLGGLLILEAKNLDHAVQLLSKHPGVKMGPWEIRETVDMTPMIQASEQRRAVAKKGGK